MSSDQADVIAALGLLSSSSSGHVVHAAVNTSIVNVNANTTMNINNNHNSIATAGRRSSPFEGNQQQQQQQYHQVPQGQGPQGNSMNISNISGYDYANPNNMTMRGTPSPMDYGHIHHPDSNVGDHGGPISNKQNVGNNMGGPNVNVNVNVGTGNSASYEYDQQQRQRQAQVQAQNNINNIPGPQQQQHRASPYGHQSQGQGQTQRQSPFEQQRPGGGGGGNGNIPGQQRASPFEQHQRQDQGLIGQRQSPFEHQMQSQGQGQGQIQGGASSYIGFEQQSPFEPLPPLPSFASKNNGRSQNTNLNRGTSTRDIPSSSNKPGVSASRHPQHMPQHQAHLQVNLQQQDQQRSQQQHGQMQSSQIMFKQHQKMQSTPLPVQNQNQQQQGQMQNQQMAYSHQQVQVQVQNPSVQNQQQMVAYNQQHGRSPPVQNQQMQKPSVQNQQMVYNQQQQQQHGQNQQMQNPSANSQQLGYNQQQHRQSPPVQNQQQHGQMQNPQIQQQNQQQGQMQVHNHNQQQQQIQIQNQMMQNQQIQNSQMMQDINSNQQQKTQQRRSPSMQDQQHMHSQQKPMEIQNRQRNNTIQSQKRNHLMQMKSEQLSKPASTSEEVRPLARMPSLSMARSNFQQQKSQKKLPAQQYSVENVPSSSLPKLGAVTHALQSYIPDSNSDAAKSMGNGQAVNAVGSNKPSGLSQGPGPTAVEQFSMQMSYVQHTSGTKSATSAGNPVSTNDAMQIQTFPTVANLTGQSQSMLSQAKQGQAKSGNCMEFQSQTIPMIASASVMTTVQSSNTMLDPNNASNNLNHKMRMTLPPTTMGMSGATKAITPVTKGATARDKKGLKSKRGVTSNRGKGVCLAARGKGKSASKEPKQKLQQPLQQEVQLLQISPPQNMEKIRNNLHTLSDQIEKFWKTTHSFFSSRVEERQNVDVVKFSQEALDIINLNLSKVSGNVRLRRHRQDGIPDPTLYFGLIKKEIQILKMTCRNIGLSLKSLFKEMKEEQRLSMNLTKSFCMKLVLYVSTVDKQINGLCDQFRTIIQTKANTSILPVATDSNSPTSGKSSKKKAMATKRKHSGEGISKKKSEAVHTGKDAKKNKEGPKAKRKKVGSNRKSKSSSGKKSIIKERKKVIEVKETKPEPQSPNVAKKHLFGPIVTIADRHPDRITNPLLELPQGSLAGDPTMPVSEYLKLMEVYFPEPDTFPMSYYSSILGIPLVSILPDGSSKLLSYCEGIKKEDDWSKIPELGYYGRLQNIRNSTLDNIDANGIRCEKGMDHVDLTWKKIMRDYRGYKEDAFIQASEFHKSCQLSTNCLSLARDANLIREGVQIRIATLDDVPNLNKFDPDQPKYSNFERLSHLMKCKNHFIIIALDGEESIIGFIHYHICWFKPKSRYSSSSEDAVLERVVHVDRVLCQKSSQNNYAEPPIESDDHGLFLVLFGLALEHCRLHVGYGMMELPVFLVPFLKSHFRMSVITRDDEHAEEDKMLLVCDLEKCSYRYAFFLRQEIELKKERPKELDKIKHRMVVQLPTYRLMKKNENESSNNDAASLKLPISIEKLYSGIETKRRHKKIQLRVVKNQITLKPTPAARKKPDSGHIANGEDWVTISCFASKTCEKARIASRNNSKHDTVMHELERQQNNLAELERKNSSILHHLLDSAYKERISFETGHLNKVRIENELTIKEFEAYVKRQEDLEKELKEKEEEEENAVCDICLDGESPGENRIIFCDDCDICVHQNCYGIEKVPQGDYFCRPCLYKKNKMQAEEDNKTEVLVPKKASTPAKVVCELCPRRSGAFVQAQVPERPGKPVDTRARWVHLLCAKWQGLNFVDHYVDGSAVLMVEDVQPLKDHFRISETSCYLCKGMRGSYNQCAHEDCDRMLHITCARSSGVCVINHGIDHTGAVKCDKNWTLFCPEHSTFDPEYTPIYKPVPLDDLIANSKTFPVEPLPKLPPKSFWKMSRNERKEYFEDQEYELEFNNAMLEITRTKGRRCELCDSSHNMADEKFLECHKCGSFAHEACTVSEWQIVPLKDKKFKATCTSCLYTEKNTNDENYETPECHMCYVKTGTLVPAFAKPVTMRKWKTNKRAFSRTLFGKDIWCHPVCGMWTHKVVLTDDSRMDCSNIVMANGTKHIDGKAFCQLCGLKDKSKVHCSKNANNNHRMNCSNRFHVTCARQAGIAEVSGVISGEYNMRCFQHAACEFTFRAFLEDMIEFEKIRAGPGLTSGAKCMTRECVTNIYHAGFRVLNCLGWAWQWGSWWVSYGDNWEPLLEKGQIEADMTDEELRKVHSTPISRRDDARKSRLVAFGAALRNRSYDDDEGDDRVPLENALRAILNIPSLVGPLTKAEIIFFVEWLSRIYRSKSPLLGLGEKKFTVAEEWEADCPVFYRDKSPKFELGKRSLPGKTKFAKGKIFEEGIHEIDDFFEKEEEIELDKPRILKPPTKSKKKKSEKPAPKPRPKTSRQESSKSLSPKRNSNAEKTEVLPPSSKKASAKKSKKSSTARTITNTPKASNIQEDIPKTEPILSSRQSSRSRASKRQMSYQESDGDDTSSDFEQPNSRYISPTNKKKKRQAASDKVKYTEYEKEELFDEESSVSVVEDNQQLNDKESSEVIPKALTLNDPIPKKRKPTLDDPIPKKKRGPGRPPKKKKVEVAPINPDIPKEGHSCQSGQTSTKSINSVGLVSSKPGRSSSIDSESSTKRGPGRPSRERPPNKRNRRYY